MAASLVPTFSFLLVTGDVHSGADEDRVVHQIFVLCALMYGLVGLMWLTYLSFGSEGTPGLKTVLLCISWSSMSMGMHVLNKTLVTALGTPSLVTAVQMTITVCATVCMSGRELLGASPRQLLFWMIVPLFFAGMLCSSAYTYLYISLSVLTIIRNLSPLIALPIECLVMPADKQPYFDRWCMLAIVVMLVGALVYGGGVHDIEIVGVLFACLNMAVAVTDRVIQRRLLTTECKDLSSGVCTLVTNLFAIFPTMFLASASGELKSARGVEGAALWMQHDVRGLLVISGFVGLFIGYLGFECQREISATSFFILQNASKIGVVSIGIIFFNDPMMFSTMLGLALSLGGSFLYSHAQRSVPKEETTETEPLMRPSGKA